MGCVAFLNLYLKLLLGEVGMVMMVVVMMVYYHYHLRLRRIGYCETEDEGQSEQKLFHIFMMMRRMTISRATLTCPCKHRFRCESAHGICFSK
jgi:hypothetical protein